MSAKRKSKDAAAAADAPSAKRAKLGFDPKDEKLAEQDRALLAKSSSWCAACKKHLSNTVGMSEECGQCKRHFCSSDDVDSDCIGRCMACQSTFCAACMEDKSANRFTAKQLCEAGLDDEEFPWPKKGDLLCCAVCSAGMREFLRASSTQT